MEREYWVAIGSNLNDPLHQVQEAIGLLLQQPNFNSLVSSDCHSTEAIGPGEQPDYINAVVRFYSSLSARDVFSILQQIEKDQGRVRDGLRWGPRVLDLDLLLCADAVIDEPDLQVPHPRMLERVFVLAPMADIDAEKKLLNGKTVREQLAQLIEQC